MNVNSYLENIAREAVLSKAEKESITASILYLRNKIYHFLSDEIEDAFVFGSYTRGTILPHKIDPRSDIDYMVVFRNGLYADQTYLNKLRNFAEFHYSRSIRKQDYPAIILELNHIKFDLVPALELTYSSLSPFLTEIKTYKIPDKQYRWIETNPNSFNKELTETNKRCVSQIKPAIRVVKYWNAHNDYIYDSYMLEKRIVSMSFWNSRNLKDYVFSIFDNLSTYDLCSSSTLKVLRAQRIVSNIRSMEQSLVPNFKEEQEEIMKLIPPVS